MGSILMINGVVFFVLLHVSHLDVYSRELAMVGLDIAELELSEVCDAPQEIPLTLKIFVTSRCLNGKTLEMCSNVVFHVNHRPCSLQYEAIVCHVWSQTAVTGTFNRSNIHSRKTDQSGLLLSFSRAGLDFTGTCSYHETNHMLTSTWTPAI